MEWKDDGPGAWKAEYGDGRVARINKKGESYVARLTGGDPGGGACGSYPSLENAKKRFDPAWVPADDAVLMAKPDHPDAPTTGKLADLPLAEPAPV